MANILASGIANVEHLQVFDRLAELRFASLEIDKVLIYLVDTVDEDALPILAEQFDMMGWNGYRLADTVQKKRDLIKTAIELHRYKGTPYSIKKALKAFGYGDSEIQEHLGTIYDGSVNHQGVVQYAAGNWATFRVILDIGNTKGINDEEAAEAVKLIDAYKNVRSHLVQLLYKANLDDTVSMSDDDFFFTVTLAQVTESVFSTISYNGASDYDGGANHSNTPDTLTIT